MKITSIYPWNTPRLNRVRRALEENWKRFDLIKILMATLRGEMYCLNHLDFSFVLITFD